MRTGNCFLCKHYCASKKQLNMKAFLCLLHGPVQPQCVCIAHIIFTFQKFPSGRSFFFLLHDTLYLIAHSLYKAQAIKYSGAVSGRITIPRSLELALKSLVSIVTFRIPFFKILVTRVISTRCWFFCDVL